MKFLTKGGYWKDIHQLYFLIAVGLGTKLFQMKTLGRRRRIMGHFRDEHPPWYIQTWRELRISTLPIATAGLRGELPGLAE